jgi:hypothetical protein
MQHWVEEAIAALTQLDAERLDRLRGELAELQRTPPTLQDVRAAQPAMAVLALLLQFTERNLRLMRRTTLCDEAKDTAKFSIYPAQPAARPGL